MNCLKCKTPMQHFIGRKEFVCPYCNHKEQEEYVPVKQPDPYETSINGWGQDHTLKHNGKFL